MKNYIDASVLCPFYVDSKPEEIVCEGVDSCMRIHHTFTYKSQITRKEKREEFMNRYCCSDYDSCPHAKTLREKYED